MKNVILITSALVATTGLVGASPMGQRPGSSVDGDAGSVSASSFEGVSSASGPQLGGDAERMPFADINKGEASVAATLKAASGGSGRGAHDVVGSGAYGEEGHGADMASGHVAEGEAAYDPGYDMYGSAAEAGTSSTSTETPSDGAEGEESILARIIAGLTHSDPSALASFMGPAGGEGSIASKIMAAIKESAPSALRALSSMRGTTGKDGFSSTASPAAEFRDEAAQSSQLSSLGSESNEARTEGNEGAGSVAGSAAGRAAISASYTAGSDSYGHGASTDSSAAQGVAKVDQSPTPTGQAKSPAYSYESKEYRGEDDGENDSTDPNPPSSTSSSQQMTSNQVLQSAGTESASQTSDAKSSQEEAATSGLTPGSQSQAAEDTDDEDEQNEGDEGEGADAENKAPSSSSISSRQGRPMKLAGEKEKKKNKKSGTSKKATSTKSHNSLLSEESMASIEKEYGVDEEAIKSVVDDPSFNSRQGRKLRLGLNSAGPLNDLTRIGGNVISATLHGVQGTIDATNRLAGDGLNIPTDALSKVLNGRFQDAAVGAARDAAKLAVDVPVSLVKTVVGATDKLLNGNGFDV